ncbi:MAG: stalk domain-containing protein [Eubacteriales bacterium]
MESFLLRVVAEWKGLVIFMRLKKFVAIILTLALTLSVTTVSAFADDSSDAWAALFSALFGTGAADEDQVEMDIILPLDYTSESHDDDTIYYSWDASSRTLTIKEGYVLSFSSMDYAVYLPEDSTIVLEGDLSISSCTYGILCDGDLLITGDGDITLQYMTKNAIFTQATNGTITILDTSVYMNFCITGIAAPNLVISNSTYRYLLGEFAIMTTGTLDIKDGSNVAGLGMTSSVVNIADSEVTSNYVYGFEGVNIVNSEIDSVVLVPEGDDYVGTIYGDMSYTEDNFSRFNAIRFAEGSSLTIVNETADLSEHIVYPENGNIVIVDGALILPDGVSEADFNTYTDGTYGGLMSEVGMALPTDSTVLVDGEEMAFEAYEIYDNNYFKLRDIAYVLNGTDASFEISWNGEVEAIEMTTGDAYTVVGGEMAEPTGYPKSYLDSTATIYLNGNQVVLTAYTIDDNNYFKLRDLGEAIGFNVSWDSDAETIAIASNEAYTAD